MFCYNCGCQLSEHDFCTSCGVDVGAYKKIIYTSNRYYNEGLERAKVRDMTGAISALHQSLKMYKGNVEARNLLGLVYFEIGEVVPALCEWVISKNQRPEKNIADDYITLVQSNTARLDALNQSAKKYNQALKYCAQDSKDLAVIQLKKVLSLNGKYLKGHLLLALLYMDSEQWEKAKKELTKALNIDRNNVQALTYMKEVDLMLAPDESGKVSKKKTDESVRYQADNEIIIQPIGGLKEKKRSGAGTLLNIALGFVIGVAAIYALVVPSVKTNEINKAQQDITRYANQIDSKNSTIADLENSIETAKEENEMLRKELETYQGTDTTIQAMDQLIQAATLYQIVGTGDVTLETAATALETIGNEVTLTDMPDSYQNLYQVLRDKIAEQYAQSLYEQGVSKYEDGKYADTIDLLTRALFYKEDMGDAYYTLGHAYRKSGDNENAISAYSKVIELMPDTERAARAKNYVDDLMPN